ncbi:hypothetical protein FKM82_018920 [Ascaphus truei]
MDINFDFKGDPTGGHIHNYLLEKSRVLKQHQGERNFHSFYQLLLGAPDVLLSSLYLRRDPPLYTYTREGANNNFVINDKSSYKAVVDSMKVIGFSSEEVDSVYKILAAILHLRGNTGIHTHGPETVIPVNTYTPPESFEQFCINYCNEKLQQLFIELILRQEQDEYQREGIEWQHIDYFNNQIIVDLVEQQHKGILSILDEACLTVGEVTDTMFLESMNTKLCKHPHYTSRKLFATDKSMEFKRDFRIKHYAGNVTYSVEGFIDKNKDTLFQDFKRLMYNSKDPVLRDMWPEGQLSISEVTKRPLTAATLFKNSMVSLVENLACKHMLRVSRATTSPHHLGLRASKAARREGFWVLAAMATVRREQDQHPPPVNILTAAALQVRGEAGHYHSSFWL